MGIAVAPIRALSNQVTIQTANAVKEYFDLCQAAEPGSGYLALPPWLQQKAVSINQQMNLAAESQSALIRLLEDVTNDQLAAPGFDKVIADLERLVPQTDSAISDTYSAPPGVVKLWQKNLDRITTQNSHIDSFVESFRIAQDENCSALLSDLADQIIHG